MRPYGQAENGIRELFGDGEERECVSGGIGAGEVGGDGIVDQRADTGGGQFFLEVVALRSPHDEEVPDGVGPLGNGGESYAGDTGQAFKVLPGDDLAPGIPFIELAEFDAEKSGLEFINAGVETGEVVLVLDACAVVAQGSHFFGQIMVIGGDRAGVAERAEVFTGVETGRGGVPQATGFASMVQRALRLGVVFDDLESVPGRDFHDGIHVGGLAVEMNRHDGFGSRGNRRFNPRRIHVVSGRIDFHGNGSGPRVCDGKPGGDEGVRRDDDLVASADAVGTQDQVQGIQTIGDTDTVAAVAVCGELGFEGVEFLAEQEPAGVHDAAVGGVKLRTEFGGGYFKVKEWNVGFHVVLFVGSEFNFVV